MVTHKCNCSAKAVEVRTQNPSHFRSNVAASNKPSENEVFGGVPLHHFIASGVWNAARRGRHDGRYNTFFDKYLQSGFKVYPW
jgi:hypothetical protein